MKLLKVIDVGLSLCCLVLMSSPVEAGPFGGSLEDKVAHMQEQLGLSDEQADLVLAIYETALEDTTCRDLEDIDARMDCIQAKRAAINEEHELVLTPEQFDDLQALREGRRSRSHRRLCPGERTSRILFFFLPKNSALSRTRPQQLGESPPPGLSPPALQRPV